MGALHVTVEHRRSQGAISTQIFNIYSHFVLWEAVSQTK